MPISDFEALTLNIIPYQVKKIIMWKDADISGTVVSCEAYLGGSAV
jgi:hypothetical protein